MHTEQWKEAERRVADFVGGERVPVPGRARGSAPDIAHPTLSLEVKHRRALPNYLREGMEQARAANDGSKVNLVVLHEHGQRYEDSYCVVPLREFVDLIGRIPGGE